MVTLARATHTAVTGRDGADGTDGVSPIAYYSTNSLGSRPTTDPPSSEWVHQDDVVDGTTYNWQVWTTEDAAGTVVPQTVSQVTGNTGIDGFNTATVSIYKRSATEPTSTDRPLLNLTYTFATAFSEHSDNSTVSN